MTNKTQLERIVSGVCITVVACLILWLCSTNISQGTRISVLENSFEYIQTSLCDLKTMIKELDK